MKFLIIILAVFFIPMPVHAVDPGEILQDLNLEKRARAISKELRCVVCQNQSIDDSDAPLARDLRILVRDRITSGDSDEAVELRVELRDARQQAAAQFFGGELFVGEATADLGQGQLVHVEPFPFIR